MPVCVRGVPQGLPPPPQEEWDRLTLPNGAELKVRRRGPVTGKFPIAELKEKLEASTSFVIDRTGTMMSKKEFFDHLKRKLNPVTDPVKMEKKWKDLVDDPSVHKDEDASDDEDADMDEAQQV